jgi:hypothetical protein
MEFVLNLDDGSIRCLSAGGRPINVRAFDFSPDHTKLVTTRADTTGTIGVLWVLDIPSGRWTQLTAPPLSVADHEETRKSDRFAGFLGATSA